MEVDETGTLERQKLHRKELVDPAIKQFKGRIFKTTGDGLLAEFPSVVDAVQCAVQIQHAMDNRESGALGEKRIRYRIGINLGDVIVDEGDIYGDGVNIAARLEAMAAPGGITISGTAYDHLKANVDVGYEALGEVQVKNIETPVRVYRVVTDSKSIGMTVPARRRTKPVPLIMAAAAIAFVGIVSFWWSSQTDFQPADQARMAFDLPDKPSVTVLPFRDLSADGDAKFLADKFVTSLITELSFLPDLFVIASNSSFALRDTELSLGEISERLGVRYLVQGSFDKKESSLRIDVQLVDGLVGNLIWSKRYERPIEDFFQLQDELIRDIALEVGGRGESGIFRAERRRFQQISNDDLTALQLFEKATQAFFKYTREGNETNGEIARDLVSRFPQFSRGYVALAYFHFGRIWFGYSPDAESDLAACFENADKAVALHAQEYLAHWVLGYCNVVARRVPEAMSAFERAHELNPHDILVRRDFAMHVLVRQEKYEEALDILHASLRLAPGQNNFTNMQISSIYFILGDYAKAVEFGQREQMRSILGIGWLGAAYWKNGQKEQARSIVEEIMKAAPDYNRQTFAATRLYAPVEAIERASEALVAAGLPEG
ncbi:adenylate/guanylate cyclase domain-containing protein [Ruegeria sp. 1NDH52C]|uniref:Adenylate/guanylate cyclase domain-containing protein n=2 Tax=Ruegeria alba TaxID=2916756 RepID=A0ABS9P2L4_9RHOB|nr:adenylate/guanylate cyclase domain-containing protein [Ruegeria alba]